jgi:hypothetical protein
MIANTINGRALILNVKQIRSELRYHLETSGIHLRLALSEKRAAAPASAVVPQPGEIG